MNDAVPLIKPQEFTVTDQGGVTKTFLLSKFDAVAGREIISKYPTSGLPKIGDYKVNEETMLKLMSYVAIEIESGAKIRLSTRALINNHIGDWETLAKIEVAMMEYNCSFFQNGRISTLLEDFVQKLLVKISEISTPSSAQSSQPEKQPSTNSGQSTH